jgi:hypothetical protein
MDALRTLSAIPYMLPTNWDAHIQAEKEFDYDNTGTGYDMVLVFDAQSDQTDEDGGETVTGDAREVYNHMIMRTGRKHIYEFSSPKFGDRFILIRASNTKLRKFAELKECKFLLDSEKAGAALIKGDEERQTAKLELLENGDMTPIYPTDCIYIPYKESEEELFWKPEGATTPIVGDERVSVFYNLMKAPEHEGGYSASIKQLAHDGLIKSFFPLHDYKQKKQLAALWMSVFQPMYLPLISIRNYFGDKISMLAGLSAHICTWLFLPALVGIAFEVLQLYYDGWSRHETAVFAYFTAFWMVVLVHRWTVKEGVLSIYFGHYSRTPEVEERRPQHTGLDAVSTIDGSPDIYYSHASRRPWLVLSWFIWLFFVVLIVAGSSGIYYVRFLLSQKSLDINQPPGRVQWIAAAITAACIQVAGTPLWRIARNLALMENHRTDSDVERSFAVKLFGFKFTLMFTTFYYLGK